MNTQRILTFPVVVVVLALLIVWLRQALLVLLLIEYLVPYALTRYWYLVPGTTRAI